MEHSTPFLNRLWGDLPISDQAVVSTWFAVSWPHIVVVLYIWQERKRVAVLEEQQRRLQEAMAAKSAIQAEDNMEMKAMKAMGAMEEGDAVFGSGAEVNLESQVYNDY